jgi:hypothetical protein
MCANAQSALEEKGMIQTGVYILPVSTRSIRPGNGSPVPGLFFGSMGFAVKDKALLSELAQRG